MFAAWGFLTPPQSPPASPPPPPGWHFVTSSATSAPLPAPLLSPKCSVCHILIKHPRVLLQDDVALSLCTLAISQNPLLPRYCPARPPPSRSMTLFFKSLFDLFSLLPPPLIPLAQYYINLTNRTSYMRSQTQKLPFLFHTLAVQCSHLSGSLVNNIWSPSITERLSACSTSPLFIPLTFNKSTHYLAIVVASMSTNTRVLIFLLSGFSWEARSVAQAIRGTWRAMEGWEGGSNVCCNNETKNDLLARRIGPFAEMWCSWMYFVFVREHLESWVIRVNYLNQVRNFSSHRLLVGMTCCKLVFRSMEDHSKLNWICVI